VGQAIRLPIPRPRFALGVIYYWIGLTLMDLDNKYELGEVVAHDSESKTFRARALAGGREVFVHILFGVPSAPGRDTLLNLLAWAKQTQGFLESLVSMMPSAALRPIEQPKR